MYSKLAMVILLSIVMAAFDGAWVNAQNAGGAAQVSLSSPDASFPEPFSNLIGLRELRDGRVVISDRIEQAVRILDFSAGTFEEIGNVGQGPGEYRMPGSLLPLPGDSTLLVDMGNMRMTAFGPDGSFGASEPMMRQGGMLIFPRGTDGAGRIYFDQAGLIAGSADQAGANPVLRLDRSTGAIDTVAFIAQRETSRVQARMRSSGGGWNSLGQLQLTAFQSQDSWAISEDGGIGVARLSDYRVEWIDGAGNVTFGSVVDYEPVSITLEDKEAWADRMASRAMMMIMRADGSGGRSSRTQALNRPDIEDVTWPEAKPPFPEGAATITPEGELWVQRHVPFGEPVTFDAFDESGRLSKKVILPEGRQIIGFGRGTLYAVTVDEDDLQWLERYVRDS